MCENPVARWRFTSSCKFWTKDELIKTLKLYCKHWCFQREIGSETGFEHFQGKLSLIKKSRTLKWLINSHNTPEHEDSDIYETKINTRLEGPWNDKNQPSYIPRQIRDITELYPWQKIIVNDADVWDTRTINWVVNETGNQGKSILKTYLGVNKLGRAIPLCNDYRDIMRIVMDTPKCKLYIIDIPKAFRNGLKNEFYAGIETLKDGYAFDDRYSFKEEYFDCPNIWVFSNQDPDKSLLSLDRWRIWDLKDKNLVRRAKLNIIT